MLYPVKAERRAVSFSLIGLSLGRGAVEHKTMDRCGQRQLDCRCRAESLYRGIDDQRNSRGDWPFCVGSCQRYLCARKRLSSGRNPDSHADRGFCGCGGESGGGFLDTAFTGPALGAMAQARTEPEGKALGEVADRNGDPHLDPGRAGDVDAPDGSPDGAASDNRATILERIETDARCRVRHGSVRLQYCQFTFTDPVPLVGTV